MTPYDLAILGGGPGGYTAALRAAQRGASVCLIEQRDLGGACLNVGCIPTKALLHASELAYRARNGQAIGIGVDGVAVDDEVLAEHVGNVVGAMRHGVAGLLEGRHVEVLAGRGRLTGPDAIEVATNEGTLLIQAKHVIIATGARPVRPDFVPWESERVMTTDEATTTDAVPKSILILGGGVIGCEFATFYAELGVQTVLVEQFDRLLPSLDPDVSRSITRSLKERDVHIRTGTTVTAMAADDEAVTTDLSADQRVVTHAALIAIGRQPNIEDIGLEAAGVTVTDGLIAVDDRGRTNVDNLYAIGDVATGKQYAHVASRMGIVAADTITGNEAADDLAVVPECVYTHPEVASVGLDQAHAAGGHDDIKVSRFFLQASGLAQAYGETEGLVKLIANESTGRVLGALLIAPRATDMIGLLTLAIKQGLSVEQLAEMIHAHPTFSEIIHEAAEAWLGLPIHKLR